MGTVYRKVLAESTDAYDLRNTADQADMTLDSSSAPPGGSSVLWRDAHILLVEDDATDHELFTRQLEAHIPSARCTTVRRLEEALEIVETTDLDVVVLDLNLPDAAGYRTLGRARRLFDLLPVIVLTGVGDEHIAAAAVRYGAKDFLVKGRCDGSALAVSIQHAVEGFRASEALRASEDRYRTLFETSRDAIYIADHEGMLRDVNDAMCSLFGGDLSTLTGLAISSLCMTTADGHRLLTILTDCGGVTDHEIRMRRLDGTPLDCCITATARYGRRDEVLGFQGTIRDTTQQRLVQTERAQAHKMESVGRLAAGIAHEINTPTQFVLDNLRFLADAFSQLRPLLEQSRSVSPLADDTNTTPDRDPLTSTDAGFLLTEIPSAINESLEGMHQISRVVTAMREFAHPGPGELEPVDVRKCIEHTLVVSRNEWKYHADVVAEFDPQTPEIYGRSDELNQVFLALIANAAQAIAERGHQDRGTIHIATKRADPWLEIAVTDNGIGIPDANLDRIFDPFFTTRRVGQGIGQGLSVARAVIVQKHAGQLAVDSQVGIGSTFTVRLPLRTRNSSRAREETQSSGLRTRRETTSKLER